MPHCCAASSLALAAARRRAAQRSAAAAPAAAEPTLATGSRRRSRSRTSTQPAPARVAVDLATGQIVFARNPHALARPGVEREARGRLRAPARRLGPGLPDRHERARRRARSTARPGTATSSSRATATRRSRRGDLAGARAQVARAASGGSRAGRRPTSPTSTRAAPAPGWKPRYYIDESPPLSALTVDRARFRGCVTARAGARRRRRCSACAARAPASRPRPAVAGAADPRRDASSRAPRRRPLLAASCAFMNRESDNFTRRAPAQAARRGRRRQGHDARRRDGRPAVAARTPASRSPACASSTAPGCRCSNRLTAAALDRHRSSPPGTTRASAARFVRSLAVAGVSGTLEHRLERPPARGTCSRRRGRLRASSALVRLRAGALRLRRDPERPAGLASSGRAGPRTGSRAVASRASGVAALERRPRRAAARRSCCAFVSFDAPGSSPTMRPVVFFETES